MPEYAANYNFLIIIPFGFLKLRPFIIVCLFSNRLIFKRTNWISKIQETYQHHTKKNNV